MKILFRADSSHEIGAGHIIRCLALATALKARGHSVLFSCLPLPGNLQSHIQEQGFPTLEHLRDHDRFDLIIIDHYGITQADEKSFRPFTKMLGVIDDWGARTHDADWIIDPSISEQSLERRKSNPSIPFYSGADWLLLRPEFAGWHAKSTPRSDFSKILLFFGGTDPNDLVLTYVTALQKKLAADTALSSREFHFLVSKEHPRKEFLESLKKNTPSVHFHFSPTSVAELISKMDFYFGSSGTITWERMALGLTGLILSVVDNQEPIATTLESRGLHTYLGRASEVAPGLALDTLLLTLKNKTQLKRQSEACLKLVDARGVDRAVQVIESMHSSAL